MAQLPIIKRSRQRTVVNRMADGRKVKLADPAAGLTEWQLEYRDLSDDEAEILQDFFEKTEGSLNSFTFVDPTANLLASSDALDSAAWLKEPLLTLSGGPEGWRLTNGGAAPQRVTQTIPAPSDFTYCLSVYARSESRGQITLVAGERTADRPLIPEWRRVRLGVAIDDPTFGVEVAPGASLEVRGMQVEGQRGASIGKPTTTMGGIYEGARFRDDDLDLVATGVNRHWCLVTIVHAVHI
jgi:hypothetical protein